MTSRVVPGADDFAEQRWGDAVRALATAPREELEPPDLERLGAAAYLTGADDTAVEAWVDAHRRHLAADARADAARCSFWAAFCLMMQGRMAHAQGWLTRTEGTIGDDVDCPARGYLLMPAVMGALDADDAATARDLAVQAGEVAERFGDRDLGAFASLGHGRALLALGDHDGGMVLLDEVMVSVTSGEVGPVTSGIVYCAVILECMQAYDLSRAAEWTAALDEWCRSQPDLVPYRGQCLVHQSQLQQAAGDWSAAVTTVASACDRLRDPPHPALGLACYQQGELHRLRGEFDAALEGYRQASRAGYEPLPGLALLELARGEVDAATATIRRALGEASQPFQRPSLLAAAVEILVAAGELDEARATAEELGELAAGARSEVLGAMAEHATGAVLLADGDAARALTHLRAASASWQRLRLPYEAARTGVLLGRACLALRDGTSAGLEFDNAREHFSTLGAEPDLQRVDVLRNGEKGRPRALLSAREHEVLGHVAAGRTNRQIAAELGISQNTVNRHIENIFAKLGVSGRAAATAFAYEHDLL